MKVLKRRDFMKMPAGTIFAKGKPWSFDQLSYKGESLAKDFVYLNLVNIASSGSDEWADRLFGMRDHGLSYPLDTEGFCRDGYFDEEDLFLVFEKEDLHALRNTISEAIAVFDVE